MGDGTRAPTQIISLPQGGGAMHGLGEKFSPDLHTGTGNFTVPIAVPPGRRGHEPKLNLVYSTGNGNGYFGLGWTLTVPGVARKTSHGVPRYQGEQDTFILSGAEDLVPVGRLWQHQLRYRPRTEGLFARIVHHHNPGAGIDHWEVATKDGLVSRYGGARPDNVPEIWRDPAVIAHPDDPRQVFAWKLAETRDPFGNLILYDYDIDEGDGHGHRWRQPLLQRIRYADYTADGETRFFASITFDYEDREDAFSDYRAGFEIRMTRRCCAITTRTHADKDQLVRRYELAYDTDPFNGVSLLRSVQVVGFDDVGAAHRDLPPLQFGYSQFLSEGRSFQPVRGADPPPASLARGNYELVDLTGDALPDVLELNGTARYWRNLGDGIFDRPRAMRRAPSGLRLADPGVQLLDADGDGHADLLVTTPAVAGYFPLRFDAKWGNFRPYTSAPTFNLEDRQVRLVDLTGDGVTDVLRASTRLECWFHDPDTGWSGPRPVGSDGPEGLPRLSFTDPRVKLADMIGDGLQDIVLVYRGNIAYWPNLGHGRFGSRVRMANSPRLPDGYDPARVLLGDVGGDGLADLVYVDDNSATVWFNRSGNGWSDPVVVKGAPAPGIADSLRVVDLFGTGTGGVLYSRDMQGPGRPSMFFLDFSGGVKPRLLIRMDNNIGALTEVDYAPSTRFALADAARPATRWRTPLPIVVPVVARVTVYDQVSRGKLVTEYCYHHGYWDGVEREFRGFGRADQLDTQAFNDYHAGSGPGTLSPVDPSLFAPPTLTKTWFHLGPIGAEDGDWAERDWSGEYWDGDPNLLQHNDRINAFLSALRGPVGGSDRRAQRDALRALRGSTLRTELYARDGSTHQDLPYTVTEQAYDLREECSGTESGQPRVFFPLLVARRTSHWERGNDPMTQFALISNYDAFGQPCQETLVAAPRRSLCRRPFIAAVVGEVYPDETHVLATHTRTARAEPDTDMYIHDRIAQVLIYELADRARVAETDPTDVQAILGDQARLANTVHKTFDRLTPGEVRLIGHQLHHYDGPACVGLGVGHAGRYGALTRSEMLVFTDEILDRAYSGNRPEYLGGSAPLPTGAPAGFGSALGYRRESARPPYAAGYYADTLRQRYDFQAVPASQGSSGFVLATRDPLGYETGIKPDRYRLLAIEVTDPAGLITAVVNDYRVIQPAQVTDPNGNRTLYDFSPIGMLDRIIQQGRNGEGGTIAKPEIEFMYDFQAYRRTRSQPDPQPVSVHTRRRIWHDSQRVSDEAIESREYSDGFGRLIQTRVRAEELIYGKAEDDVGLPVVASDSPVPVTWRREADRVVVSGWQVYDNKGQIAEKYEPFFATGWDYQPATDARRGRHLTMRYDPRGHLIWTIHPNGSEQRVVFGIPAQLADPDKIRPTPWETFVYDPNDLAPVTMLTVPACHRGTPVSTVVDAMGRTICEVARNGAEPAQDWYLTRSTYDIHGNLLTVVDGLGRVAAHHAYDLLNRPLLFAHIDAGLRTSVLDATGRLAEYRDSRGGAVLRQYNHLTRLTHLWARNGRNEALTLRQLLVYGEDGDREAAKAANLLGRLRTWYDEGGVEHFDLYDYVGNLLSRRRMVVSDIALAAGWAPDWAAADATVSLDDEAPYERSSRYDALNRPVEVILPRDVNNLRPVLKLHYTARGALERIELDNTPYVRHIGYNAKGQRVLALYATSSRTSSVDGIMTRYAYDPLAFHLARLRSEPFQQSASGTTLTGMGPPLQDFSYLYDLVGNIRTIEDTTPRSGVSSSPENNADRLARHFGYDPLYRLTSADGRACKPVGTPRQIADIPGCGWYPAPGDGPMPDQDDAPDVTERYVETYRYDEAGNLLELRCSAGAASGAPNWGRLFGLGGLPPEEWHAAPNNRVTSVSQAGTAHSYSYDDNGNLLGRDNVQTNVWDHGDRLVAIRDASTSAAIRARYLYDAYGARVKVWLRDDGLTSVGRSTVYIDGVFEHCRGGLGGPSNSLQVMDGTQRIAQIRRGSDPEDRGPAIQYHLGDHLGNSSLVVDDTASWLDREEYFPYGETSFGGFAGKRYRFGGQQRDEESGLYYHGKRYYAPWLGKWVSCDPAGMIAGPNLYRFARNNPVMFRDPSGTYEEPGHYYTVYLVSLAVGFPRDIAFKNAFYAQMPDEAKELDAFNTRDLERGARDVIWEGLHALTGRPAGEEQAYREFITRGLTPGTLEFGLALHALGDSYAHSMMSDPRRMYGPEGGHKEDLTKPDNIALRPDLYRVYVGKLYGVLSDMAKQQGYRPSLSLQTVLLELSTVLQTQKPTEQSARLRAIIQRQFKSINTYMPERTPGYDLLPLAELQKGHPDEIGEATLRQVRDVAAHRHAEITNPTTYYLVDPP